MSSLDLASLGAAAWAARDVLVALAFPVLFALVSFLLFADAGEGG